MSGKQMAVIEFPGADGVTDPSLVVVDLETGEETSRFEFWGEADIPSRRLEFDGNRALISIGESDGAMLNALVIDVTSGAESRVSKPVIASVGKVGRQLPANVTVDAGPSGRYECGSITLGLNSEDGPSKVPSEGVNCAAVTALVSRIAEEHNFCSGPSSFEIDEYSCTVETDDSDVLPVGHHQCSNRKANISWDQS